MPTQTYINGQLSSQALEFIQTKVASGKYASEADVISDTLATMSAWEADVLHYEKTVVVPAYEHYLAHPETAISAEDMGRELDALDRADGL